MENKDNPTLQQNKTKKQKQKFPLPNRVIYDFILWEFYQACKNLKYLFKKKKFGDAFRW